MKKFAVSLTLLLLVLVVAYPIMSNAQVPEPPIMEETSWWAFIYYFDSSGKYTGWSRDRFTFVEGWCSCKFGESRYTESYGVVLPDLAYTIWEFTIWLDFGGELHYMGIRSSKNPNLIIGQIVNSLNPGSMAFFGFKTWLPKEN